MALFYHGTTAKNIKNILEGNDKLSGPWNCSDQDRIMYLWSLDKFVNTGECKDHEEKDRIITQAFESAQIQAAIIGDDDQLIVLELEIDSEMTDDDLSCENMHSLASCFNCSDFDRSMIRRVFVCDFNKWHSPFIVAGLLGNQYFNSCMVDETLITIAEQVSKSEIFLDEVFEFNWYESDDYR